MNRLIDKAHRHGFRRMISMNVAGNLTMRALAVRQSFARRLDSVGTSQAIHTLDLEAMKP